MLRRVFKRMLVRSLERREWRVERRIKRLELRLNLIQWRLERLQ